MAASQPSDAADDSGSKTSWWERHVVNRLRNHPKRAILAVAFALAYFICLLFALNRPIGHGTSYEVTWISISTNKVDEGSVVDWNIEISINNERDHINSFEVWMPEDLKATVNGLPFVQDPQTTMLVNASRKVYLSSRTMQELVSGFNITLKVAYVEVDRLPIRAEFVCGDLRVNLSSDAGRGSMVGGPKPCPIRRSYIQPNP